MDTQQTNYWLLHQIFKMPVWIL